MDARWIRMRNYKPGWDCEAHIKAVSKTNIRNGIVLYVMKLVKCEEGVIHPKNPCMHEEGKRRNKANRFNNLQSSFDVLLEI